MTKDDIMLFVVVALGFLLLGYGVYNFKHSADRCHARGGVFAKTGTGYECVAPR